MRLAEPFLGALQLIGEAVGGLDKARICGNAKVQPEKARPNGDPKDRCQGRHEKLCWGGIGIGQGFFESWYHFCDQTSTDFPHLDRKKAQQFVLDLRVACGKQAMCCRNHIAKMALPFWLKLGYLYLGKI